MRQLVAILRGVTPDRVEGIGAALLDAGIAMIEVPLNSPAPYDSIDRLANLAGTHDDTLIGAGTVLEPEQVARVAEAGGRLIVSPDTNPTVIAEAKRRGLVSCPGAMTPTECLAALRAGADMLKLFPAAQIGPAGLAAIRAVLPEATRVLAVGGAGPETFGAWIEAGAAGFGIGTALYRPGDSAETVGARAVEIVRAFDAVVQPR